MNYFAPRTAAERYAKGRPYHHHLIAERIRETIELDGPVPLALDVACGTGMSCTALKAVAKRITGIDNAPEMLALAPRDDRITYLEGAAEALPVPDGYCDLMTVSSAFHWFDRTRFFPEAKRVLRPNGWLVLYNVDMRHEELVDYMLTQSNVIAAVENGKEDIDEVRDWLLTNTRQFYGQASTSRMLVFHTTIWCLREQH